MVIWSIRKFYIPILLLNNKRFKKKLEFYLDFENFGFITNLEFSGGVFMGVAEVKIQKNIFFLTFILMAIN